MNGEQKRHVKGKASRNEIISKHIDFNLTSFYEFLILWMSQFLPKSAYFSIVDNLGHKTQDGTIYHTTYLNIVY